MNAADLPKKFVETITGAHGDAGWQWLQDLPQVIAGIEQKWGLSVGRHFSNLSYHYVAPCKLADGGDAVLKLGPPADPDPTIFNEAAMLKLNNGDGMVRLLKFDQGRRAMLIERLKPGEHLRSIFADNETAVAPIAADLMKQIWREPPAEHNFPAVEDWFYRGFDKARNVGFAPEIINKASRIFEELTSATNQRILLHGDLHHWNILSAERDPFLVIDPKGIIGDPAYEMSTFLINHSNWLGEKSYRQEKLTDAINEFSRAFDIGPDTIRRWTYCQSILSAWWTFEGSAENWRGELERYEIWDV